MLSQHLSRRAPTTVPAPVVVAPTQDFDGDDGKWSTFFLSVGTPPQSFRVVPSTLTSETWVIDPLGCVTGDPSDCQTERGGQPFNGQQARGFLTNGSSTWQEIGLFALTAGEALGINDNGLFGYDTVALNNGNGSQITSSGQSYPGVSLLHQTVGSIAAKDYFLGMLGMSTAPSEFSSSAPTISTFLFNLFVANLIPSLSYSYTAGASYGENGNNNFGSLVLGGMDTSRFDSTNMVSIPFSSTDSAVLTVGVQSIIATNVASGTASLTKNGGHLSLIDSSESQIWLPTDVCDTFATEFGLIYDPNTKLYVINDTQHAALASANPSITFTIGQQSYSTGASASIVLPYAAFDYAVAWPFYSESTRYFPIRRANTSSEYRLGRTFLQEAFVTVDYGRTTFNLSQALFPSSGTNSSVIPITNPNAASPPAKISTGAIVGVAVGGVLALAAIIALIVWLIRRHRRSSAVKEEKHELEAHERDEEAFKVHEVDGSSGGAANRLELADTDVHSPFYGKQPLLGRQELEAHTPAAIYELEDSSTMSTRTPVSAETGTRGVSLLGGGHHQHQHHHQMRNMNVSGGGTAMSNGSSSDATTSPFSPNSLYSDESRRFGAGRSSGGIPSPLYAPSPRTPESGSGRRLL